MKKIITLLVLLISINWASAQFSANNALYYTCDLNLGNYVGFDINLNYVYKEKYTFKIGYTGNLRRAKSEPKDYTPGLRGIMSFGLAGAHDELENFQIGVGRMYKLNQSGTIRANISVALGYTTIREPENWQKVNGGLFGENYTWDYREYNTISLTINPKIEFPFTRFYGLSLSPMLQINKDRAYIGIGIGQMLGLLRKKKNKPISKDN